MKCFQLLLVLLLGATAIISTAQDSLNTIDPQLSYNKEVARGFYEDLWFSNNTGQFDKYMADEYIIHDIGDDRMGVEDGIVQKEIADFFWSNGNMEGEIEYQLASDDMVATRWIWTYKPTTMLGRFVVGDISIPIINVFRIRNGKIVEIWNHRYDIDTNRTNMYVIKGLLIGLLIAMIPFTWALYLRRKLKRSRAD